MDPQLLIQMLLSQQGSQQGNNTNSLFRAFQTPPMFGQNQVRTGSFFNGSDIGLNGGVGQLISLLIQGLLPQLLGPNFIPGQFSPDRNLFDQRSGLQYLLQQRQAIEQASREDADTYFRLIQGSARLAGIDFLPGGEREQAAQRFAQDLTFFGPIFSSLFPETFDQIHGIRGSAQSLARNVFQGSQFLRDPVTGQIGFTGQSAGQLSRELFRQLYGPDADLTQVRGFGAGRIGEIFNQLTAQGVSPQAFLSREEQLDALVQSLARPTDQIESTELQTLRENISVRYGLDQNQQASGTALTQIREALQELSQTDTPAFENALRSFDATRTANTLRSFAGAVSAMRDIFGDLGRPNAPMVELINGLNTLTQGGLSRMSADSIEQSVRNTAAVARLTGVGIEGILGFAGTAGQTLDRVGLQRWLAPDIARSAAAFGFGFGVSGQPVNLSALDREQATQLDIQLRSQAAASPQAIRLAALAQLGTSFVRQSDVPGGVGGGLAQAPNTTVGFAPNTEAFAIFQALQRGQTTYTFNGQQQSIFQSEQRISSILQQAGVNPVEIQTMLSRPGATFTQTIQRFGIQDLVRQGQGDLDANTAFSAVFQRASAQSLSGLTGVSQTQRSNIANLLGPAIYQASRQLFESNPEIFSSGRERDRNRELIRLIRSQLGNRLPPQVTDVVLENLINNAIGEANAFARTEGSGFEGYGNFLSVLQLNSNRTFRLQQQTQAESSAIAGLQTALSGIGQQGLAARISDFIQNAPPGGGSVQNLIFRMLGGVPTQEAVVPVQALVTRLVDLQRQFESAPSRFDTPQAIQQERDRVIAEIRQISPDLLNALDGNVTNLSEQSQTIVRQFQATRAIGSGVGGGLAGAFLGNNQTSLALQNPLTPRQAAQSVAGGLGAAVQRTPATGGLGVGAQAGIPNTPTATTQASNVNISSTNVALSGQNVTVTANLPQNNNAQQQVNNDNRPLNITGTLTLEGLDAVVLAGQAQNVKDPRDLVA